MYRTARHKNEVVRETPQPVVYMITSAGSTLIVRARESVADAEQAMRDLWPKYLTNAVPRFRQAKDVFAESYADDARLARLLALSTLIAMLIAGGGAFVLTADAVQRRTARSRYESCSAREAATRRAADARAGYALMVSAPWACRRPAWRSRDNLGGFSDDARLRTWPGGGGGDRSPGGHRGGVTGRRVAMPCVRGRIAMMAGNGV